MSRIDPAYFEAVAQEQRNRLFAYLDDAEPLCGNPVVNLTWRIFFDLHAAGNAYVGRREPTPDDFFYLMWRLHPWYRRGARDFPNLRRDDPRPGAFRLWLARRALMVQAYSKNLNATEAEIRQRIQIAFQDIPASSDGDEEFAPAKLSMALNLFDSIQAYFAHHCGYTRAQIFDSPIAWTFQLIRAQWFLNAPKAAANRFIPPSASLLKFVD